MDKDVTKVMIVVGGRIVTALLWGELLGGVISKPIAAWRTKEFYTKAADAKSVGTMFDVMNQRICTLEEKVLGESK